MSTLDEYVEQHTHHEQPYELYRFIHDHGLKDIGLFPVECIEPSIPNSQFATAARHIEGKWMRILQSHVPAGYNATLEPLIPARFSCDTVIPKDHGNGIAFNVRLINNTRIFGYKNFVRRITAAARHTNGSTLETLILKLSPPHSRYKLQTLQKMHIILSHTNTQDLSLSHNLPFEFTTAHHSKLLTAIHTVLHQRSRRTNLCSSQRSLFVARFLTPVLDHINLPGILSSSSNVQLLPQQCPPPMLAFSYPMPIGQCLFNYKSVCNMPWNLQQNITNSPSCICTTRPDLTNLIPEGCQHIITTLPDALPTDNLKNLWPLGAKHRPYPCQPDSTFTKQDIKDHFVSAIDNYIQKMQHQLRPRICSFYGWKQKVLAEITQAIDQIPHDVLISTVAAIEGQTVPDYATLRITQHDVQMLRNNIHPHFVITTVDKASNTLVLVCKKHYLTTIHSDLTDPNNHYYSPSTFTPEQLLRNHNAFYSNNQFSIPHKSHFKLPSFAAMPKLHKSPIGHRFLVCSHNTSLTALSKWLSYCCKAIGPDVDNLWFNMLNTLGTHGQKVAKLLPTSWILTNSAGVIPMIKQFNSHYSTAVHRCTDWNLECFDFERLYTNLPIQDLISKISQLIHLVFTTLHPNHEAIKVHQHHTPTWLTQEQLQNLPFTGKDKHGAYRIFSAASFSNCLSYLLCSTYFTFGHKVFRQIKGIPMGTNCAVYLANYYLFMYEYLFVSQLVIPPAGVPDQFSGIRGQVIWAFAFSARYIDDFLSIHNPIFSQLKYVSQQLYGLHGIYPDCLVLSSASKGTYVNYMDLTIGPNLATNLGIPYGALTTFLYDKRRQPGFQKFKLVRFPHISSRISAFCKYNILSSQFHRYRRIILDRTNFIAELANLLNYMINVSGYSSTKLMAKLKTLMFRCQSHLQSHPHFILSEILCRLHRTDITVQNCHQLHHQQ